jgi:hypothetical protein
VYIGKYHIWYEDLLGSSKLQMCKTWLKVRGRSVRCVLATHHESDHCAPIWSFGSDLLIVSWAEDGSVGIVLAGLADL